MCICVFLSKKKYDTFNNLQSIFGEQKWRNRDVNVFKIFFCYEIIEINQGRVFCGEMFDHFNHGKCWSKASGPISSVSPWMELSDQTWTINCSALSLMPTIQRRTLSFKDKVVHESWPNEFLSYPRHERGWRNCWIDVTTRL